jgi:putative copper export protein
VVRRHIRPPPRSGGHGTSRREPIVSVWALVRFVHVVLAMAWVGSQLLLSLLVLPVLRRRLDAATRAPLTREVGIRFGVFTVAVFLPLQALTGLALAAHHGVTLRSLAEPGYGRILGAKVALFAAVLLVSGAHGVAVGRGQDRLARVLGVATLLGSVGVVLLATALVS